MCLQNAGKRKEVLQMILYFSGTGNSAFVAEKLSGRLNDEMYSINDSMKEKKRKKINSEKPLVFVLPTYGWRIPRPVTEWITKMTFTGNKNVYFVMTCGGSIGNAGKYVQKLCRKKDFTFMGCQEIVMPENYIAMFPVPEEPEAIAVVMRAEPVIERTAEIIEKGGHFDEKKPSFGDRLSSSIVNELFYAVFVKDKKFYASEACIGCGKCAEVCPLHNIKLKDKKPAWNGKCTHCMACICGCPKEAIEYGKISQGKRRYHCPV